MLTVLSTANLFVVVDEPSAGAVGQSQAASIRVGAVDGRSSAYLFTSESLLCSWCAKQRWQPACASVSAIDLSLSLPQGVWVEIDPGTPHHVVLSPKQLERLGQPFDKQAAPVAVDSDFTRWSASEVGDTQRQTPAEMFPSEGASVVEALPEQPAAPSEAQPPAKKRAFMRSNPTTIFTAPTLEKKTDLESRPRTYTSSNLKKVIRPTKPGGDSEG
jgi:hypothetical protein